ncbi:iron-sulfur cluster repair di-iron protein, ric [Flaviflexus ciconiae]|uniref:Iron-sulfur cluster repair di-iron protein, ric n=2 Tax=Actinomycetaceae TaxID=2049 RepID=A0A3Q9G963_9ACTO|nr:iron-sulfur cluster repair di-iron protein, ric [Flaviflexus ciconiae]
MEIEMPALDEATKLAPLIERVHGANHPELTRVRELTEAIAGAESPSDKDAFFAELRTVTNNYTVPADGCEAYQGTYASLKAADQENTRAL